MIPIIFPIFAATTLGAQRPARDMVSGFSVYVGVLLETVCPLLTFATVTSDVAGDADFGWLSRHRRLRPC